MTLNSSNSYYLTWGFDATQDKTISGNGATITVYGGPLRVLSNATLTVSNCVIACTTSWGVLAASGTGTFVANDCSVTGNGANTGIFVSETATFRANNVAVQSCGIGLNAFDTVTVDLTNTSFSSCAYSFQQNAGTLTWNGGTVNQSAGSAVFVSDGTVNVSNVTVTQTSFGSIGFNFHNGTSGALHGVSVLGSTHGVQIAEGAFTIDAGSVLNGGSGSGIAVNTGGAVTVRDSTFINYQNSIDVQLHSPGGTADAERCTFYTPQYSALSIGNAHDVRLVDSVVQSAGADGIYFYRSTGIVERCRVMNSVMTGVAFMGCSAGNIVVRDSLISGSGHQGVAVVRDELDPSRPSIDAQVLNNTVVGSVICNLLVDNISTAYVKGNIFAQAPDYCVRFKGTQGMSVDSCLMVENQKGIEIQGGNVGVYLSSIIGHNAGAVLAYQNAFPTLRFVDFRDNDRGGGAHDYSLFVNDGSAVYISDSTLGLCGEWGVYNNAASLNTDACQNYWGTDQGPKVQWDGSSPGASVEWNYTVGASVAYNPWRTGKPVESNYTTTLYLWSDSNLVWDSGCGAALGLTARSGIAATGNQIAGVLRCIDTSSLADTLPPDFYAGRLYVVWVARPLREVVQQGTIAFFAPEISADAVALMYREADGAWTQEDATWSLANRTLYFSPANADRLNGTFALVLDASVPTPTPTPTPSPTPEPLSARHWQIYD